MDAQLHGEAFDLQCRLFGIGLSVGIKQVVILLNGSTEVFVDAPHVTLHERRRKVRLQSGIRTAFGNHTLVVARTRRQLRQQHHISQFYTRQCQPAVIGSNITPRKLAVECHDLRHPLGANRCSRPLGILLRRDRFGIAVFQKIGLSTARIGVEHATLTLNQLF